MNVPFTTTINHPPLPSLWGRPHATCHIKQPTASCIILPAHLPNHLRRGQIFPAFKHYLVGIGKFCDVYCKVLFSKESVTVFDPSDDVILAGWRKYDGAKMWHFSLRPRDNLPPSPPDTSSTTLGAYSAHDLPIVHTLV